MTIKKFLKNSLKKEENWATSSCVQWHRSPPTPLQRCDPNITNVVTQQVTLGATDPKLFHAFSQWIHLAKSTNWAEFE